MKNVEEYIYIGFKILSWVWALSLQTTAMDLIWREAELEMTIAECKEVVYSFILLLHALTNTAMNMDGEMDDEKKWMTIGNLKVLNTEYGSHSSSFEFSYTKSEILLLSGV